MSEPDDDENPGPESMLFGVPLPEGNGLIGWGTLVVLIYVALTLGTGGLGKPSIAEVLRGTGRISMVVFLLAYVRVPLSSLTPDSPGGWAARNYSKLLLLLASSHTIHAIAIAALAYLYAPGFGTLALVGGGLGYLFVYVLAALAATGMLARAPGEAGRIETIAIHYVWLVFTATTATSTLAKPESVPFTALAIVAAYYRYSAAERPAR